MQLSSINMNTKRSMQFWYVYTILGCLHLDVLHERETQPHERGEGATNLQACRKALTCCRSWSLDFGELPYDRRFWASLCLCFSCSLELQEC